MKRFHTSLASEFLKVFCKDDWRIADRKLELSAKAGGSLASINAEGWSSSGSKRLQVTSYP